MYLRHHYLLDLLGGAAYCLLIWYFLLPVHSKLVPWQRREQSTRELDV
jgi:membrane-associated phospholipid phosphatase